MPHDLIVSVLSQRGIGGKVLQWISDFLRRRSFRVKVNDELSSEGLVTTGCPQGTVLGSLLFLLFIDQVKLIIPPGVKFAIYADDIKLYAPIRNEGDSRQVQELLHHFSDWATRMGLRLSAHKCGVLHIGSNNHRFEYILDGAPLEKITVAKDLGVRFSSNLNFGEQVTHVVKNCSMMCNWILRAFCVRNMDVYMKLYSSHVLPLLMYACQVWSPGRAGDFVLLERMQRRFLRRVEFRCNLPRHSIEIVSVEERFRTLDMRMFNRIMENEEFFDMMFDLSASRSRRGFILKPKVVARTSRVSNLFPWRIVKMINQ